MQRSLLLLSLTALPLIGSAQCTELFFSEYVEGSSQSKALEVYNPTNGPIDLSTYVIKRYSNGSFTATESLTLSGTVAAHDVAVVVNGQLDSNSFGQVDPALYAMGDIISQGDHAVDPMYFNGDDAMTLEKTNATIVDIIGEVGVDPGASWTDDASANYTDANGGAYWTANQTLIRKHTVLQGVTNNPSPFNVTLEWDSLPINTWTNLGQHTCDCYVVGIEENTVSGGLYVFPNPSIDGNVMLKATATINTVEVIDAQGRSVFAATLSGNSGEYLVTVPDAIAGIYLVKATLSNGARVTRRFTAR